MYSRTRLRGFKSIGFAKSTLIHPLERKTQARTDVKETLEQREAGWMRWNDEEKQTFREICGQTMETLGHPIPC